MKDIKTYINEASDYKSRSGRTATSKDQFVGTIYDVTPPSIEFEKAKKLLTADGKSVNAKAYEKFLKLSNTQFKVCNRTFALLQHIKNNGGNIEDALEVFKDVWTGYFTEEDIFGFNLAYTDDILKDLNDVLD